MERHTSLDFSHTSLPKQDWTTSNPCLVQSWLCDVSLLFINSSLFRMNLQATVQSMMSFSLSLFLACLGAKINGNTNSMVIYCKTWLSKSQLSGSNLARFTRLLSSRWQKLSVVMSLLLSVGSKGKSWSVASTCRTVMLTRAVFK